MLDNKQESEPDVQVRRQICSFMEEREINNNNLCSGTERLNEKVLMNITI